MSFRITFGMRDPEGDGVGSGYGVDRDMVRFASCSECGMTDVEVDGVGSVKVARARVKGDYAIQFQDYSQERVISKVMMEFQRTVRDMIIVM
ncbi:F-Box Only Protein 9 [Manis pentadactyla]|nr:F-Box Only Protein 9 [Manis pentadactyla]